MSKTPRLLQSRILEYEAGWKPVEARRERIRFAEAMQPIQSDNALGFGIVRGAGEP
jgi:hypothetical protein